MQRLRAWWAGRYARRAARMLVWIGKNAPQILIGHIQERAGETALQVVMGYLEREGLIHCAVCPNRRGPHRKIGPYYACPKHVAKVQEIVDAKEAEVKASQALKAAA